MADMIIKISKKHLADKLNYGNWRNLWPAKQKFHRLPPVLQLGSE